jgi:5-hydroxyisourate hydrolase-like protein (transthyretin family)
MNLAIKSARLILLVLVSFAAAQSFYAQTTNAQKISFGSVAGRVTIKGKGAQGVAIGLRRIEVGSAIDVVSRVTTDQDGNYRISNVPAGSYELITSYPSFVPADQSTSSRKTVFVSEGENVEGMDFSLVRGGVITGRVTDGDGRPVIQQQVNLYRADAWEQRPQGQTQPVFPILGSSTDDRGIYRVFGLVAGKYKVAVGRGDDTFTPPQIPGRPIYKRVFHPDITDPAKATIIEVTEGSEATNIDISLERPVENFSVSGRTIDGETGAPVAGIRVAMERVGERLQMFTNFGTTNAQGDFIIDNVTAGKYVFSVINERGRTESYLERTPAEVIDQNVTGVVLKLAKGGSVSGMVAIENENPKALAKLRQAEVQVYVTPPGGTGGRSSASVIAADGSFRAAGLPPGTAGVFLSGGASQPGLLRNLYLIRVERDGATQPGNRFEIKDGENVSGVRLVVIYGDATLRGVISIQNGKLTPDTRFYVRLARPGEPPLNYGFTQVDARGHFLVEGMPAGAYELQVSLTSVDHRPRRPIKQPVSLTSGATTEVTVVIDLAEPNVP